jgi:hypothetical protein
MLRLRRAKRGKERKRGKRIAFGNWTPAAMFATETRKHGINTFK